MARLTQPGSAERNWAEWDRAAHNYRERLGWPTWTRPAILRGVWMVPGVVEGLLMPAILGRRIWDRLRETKLVGPIVSIPSEAFGEQWTLLTQPYPGPPSERLTFARRLVGTEIGYATSANRDYAIVLPPSDPGWGRSSWVTTPDTPLPPLPAVADIAIETALLPK